jgi:hypothetical protein
MMDMKHYMLTLMAVLASLTVTAQSNRIYIEDFEIDCDSAKMVQVMLANVDPTRGIQFNLRLPAGLSIEDYDETAYSRRYSMSLTSSFVPDYDGYLMFLYPSQAICFPPDTMAVIKLTLAASHDFRGGDLLIWQCRGSTIDNETIYMDGDTTHVTVPTSTLIGIPIDQKPTEEQYFNLMGLPIASPDMAPVAIQVTTRGDGVRTSRKVASVH